MMQFAKVGYILSVFAVHPHAVPLNSVATYHDKAECESARGAILAQIRPADRRRIAVICIPMPAGRVSVTTTPAKE
jgi:hypothetical protein